MFRRCWSGGRGTAAVGDCDRSPFAQIIHPIHHHHVTGSEAFANGDQVAIFLADDEFTHGYHLLIINHLRVWAITALLHTRRGDHNRILDGVQVHARINELIGK